MSEAPKKMGRPVIEPDKRKGAVVSMRFNEIEYMALQAASAKRGTLTEWAREALLSAARKS